MQGAIISWVDRAEDPTDRLGEYGSGALLDVVVLNTLGLEGRTDLMLDSVALEREDAHRTFKGGIVLESGWV